MNETMTRMISHINFPLLHFRVPNWYVNKHLHCFPQMYSDTFNPSSIGWGCAPSAWMKFFVTSEPVQWNKPGYFHRPWLDQGHIKFTYLLKLGVLVWKKLAMLRNYGRQKPWTYYFFFWCLFVLLNHK